MAEYAQCPVCHHDGPHTDAGDGDLECGACYSEFPNPFWDPPQQEEK